MATQETNQEARSEPIQAARPGGTWRRDRFFFGGAVLALLSVAFLLLAHGVDRVQEAAERVH
jgi:hypothetical protein